jgi:hypothetical protein
MTNLTPPDGLFKHRLCGDLELGGTVKKCANCLFKATYENLCPAVAGGCGKINPVFPPF